MLAEKIDLEELTEPTAASDFFFYAEADEDTGDTCVFFCPRNFFEKNKKMSTKFYFILEETMPDEYDELAENCYSAFKPLAEVEEEMAAFGFVKNEEFSEFVATADEEENAGVI